MLVHLPIEFGVVEYLHELIEEKMHHTLDIPVMRSGIFIIYVYAI